MGYRSEVNLVISRQGMSQLYKDIPSHMNALVEMADKFVQKDNSFMLHWSYIKWYDEYPDIRKLTLALSYMNSEEYYFLRIGENSDDLEESGGYWDNPFNTCISRSIHCDTDGCKDVDLTVFQ